MQGPLSLGNSFPGNSDAYSNKEPATCSYSLLCTDEKLRPQSQGYMVTSSAGGTRHCLGEPPPGAGCHPVSYPLVPLLPAAVHLSGQDLPVSPLYSCREELSFLPPGTVHCFWKTAPQANSPPRPRNSQFRRVVQG